MVVGSLVIGIVVLVMAVSVFMSLLQNKSDVVDRVYRRGVSVCVCLIYVSSFFFGFSVESRWRHGVLGVLAVGIFLIIVIAVYSFIKWLKSLKGESSNE